MSVPLAPECPLDDNREVMTRSSAMTWLQQGSDSTNGIEDAQLAAASPCKPRGSSAPPVELELASPCKLRGSSTQPAELEQTPWVENAARGKLWRRTPFVGRGPSARARPMTSACDTLEELDENELLVSLGDAWTGLEFSEIAKPHHEDKMRETPNLNEARTRAVTPATKRCIGPSDEEQSKRQRGSPPPPAEDSDYVRHPWPQPAWPTSSVSHTHHLSSLAGHRRREPPLRHATRSAARWPQNRPIMALRQGGSAPRGDVRWRLVSA